MLSHAKVVTFILLILAHPGMKGQSTQPSRAKRQLHYLEPGRAVGLPGKHIYVTHRAKLNLMRDRNFDWGRVIYEAGMLDTPAGKSMSDEQKALVRAGFRSKDGFRFVQAGSTAKTPATAVTVWLYAVSEPDARKMVEALLADLDCDAATRLERLREAVSQERKEKAELEEQIPKREGQLRELVSETEKLGKVLHYRDLEEASRSIRDYNQILRGLEVDIAGLDAKIQVITKKVHEAKTKDQLTALISLLIAQDIEMAGALARKHAAESGRSRAEQFYDVKKRRQRTATELDEQKARLDSIRRRGPEMEKRLADPPAMMKPVIVLDNEVVIEPVRLDTATRPNPYPETGRADINEQGVPRDAVVIDNRRPDESQIPVSGKAPADAMMAFPRLEKRVARAPLIVRAEVAAIGDSDATRQEGFVFTDISFKVTSVIKGQLTADRITVSVDRPQQAEQAETPYAIGKDVILFLRELGETDQDGVYTRLGASFDVPPKHRLDDEEAAIHRILEAK